MPEGLRLPLLLSTVAGLSVPEIERVLNLNEVAVRQRLSRARRMFQSLYAYESGEQVLNQEVEPRQAQTGLSASRRIGAHSLQGASMEAGS
jgi:hypothetical protein